MTAIKAALFLLVAGAADGSSHPEPRPNVSLTLGGIPFIAAPSRNPRVVASDPWRRTRPAQDIPKPTHARLRARQLARSVELFGRFTGRHPRTLDDLKERPEWLEDDVFFPEGGFLLDPSPLTDPWDRPYALVINETTVEVHIVSLGEDGAEGGTGPAQDIRILLPPVTRRPVGAPTDRVRAAYQARVSVHLVAAGVRASRDLHGKLPGTKDDLDFPTGKAVQLTFEGDRVRVEAKAEERVTAENLTDEERDALQRRAEPVLAEEERSELLRMITLLGDETPVVRRGADALLRRWGPAARPLLLERKESERNETVLREINVLLGAIPDPPPAWKEELADPVLRVGQEGDPAPPRKILVDERPGPAFIDFTRTELQLRGSFLVFSDDFEADPEVGAGLAFRAPLPWLSRSVFGFGSDALGIFADITVATVERDLSPEPPDPDGTITFLGGGFDFTVVDDGTFLFRLAAGAHYGDFGDVTELDDGTAFRGGVLGAVKLFDGVHLSLNPEVGFPGTGDHVLFVHAGLAISF